MLRNRRSGARDAPREPSRPQMLYIADDVREKMELLAKEDAETLSGTVSRLIIAEFERRHVDSRLDPQEPIIQEEN